MHSSISRTQSSPAELPSEARPTPSTPAATSQTAPLRPPAHLPLSRRSGPQASADGGRLTPRSELLRASIARAGLAHADAGLGSAHAFLSDPSSARSPEPHGEQSPRSEPRLGSPGGGDAFFGDAHTTSRRQSQSAPELDGPGGGEAFFEHDDVADALATLAAAPTSMLGSSATAASQPQTHGDHSGYMPDHSLDPATPSDFSVNPYVHAVAAEVANAPVDLLQGGASSLEESSRLIGRGN